MNVSHVNFMDLNAVNSDLSDLLKSVNGCQFTDIEDGRILQVPDSTNNTLLNILHLNIRSLNRNRDSLKMLLADLQEKGIVVHILGLCEMFLSEQSKNFVNIENYQAVHGHRTDRTGGGTSIYYHDSVRLIRELNVPNTSSFESTAIVIKYYNKEFFISEFYQPPNTNCDEFFVSLKELISIASRFRYGVICADQNLDLLKSSVHQVTSNFFSLMLDSSFVPYIVKPTRTTHHSSTLIDNIYVKMPLSLENYSFVIVDPMSDHFPCLVSMILKCKKTSGTLTLERRKLNDNAMLKIQQYLLFHDWRGLNSLSVDQGYEYLINVITKAMNLYAPVKVVKVKRDDTFREGWLTVQLKKYNVKCRKLCDKARSTGRLEDETRYKRYRNTLNRLKLHEKRKHYQDMFLKIGKNSKLLWNVMNSLIKKVNNKFEITEIIDENGSVCSNQQEICNIFNKHFASAGKKVQQSIAESSEIDPTKYVRRVETKMKFSPVSEGELCKIVLNLKDKSSSGLDGISNILLKKLISVIKQPLCVIINSSLNTGIFPSLMKIAKIVSLFKAGNVLDPDNFRPISLLPVLSKVLEKVVYLKTVEHLGENHVLYHRQYGFRKNHSTIDAVTNFSAEVLSAFEENKFVVTVFIDLKKAFDTVKHDIILAKLEQVGIRDEELNWYRSYLTHRSHCIMIGSSTSEKIECEVGVAQGSLLGVLLCRLAINDLFKCLKFCTSILYADDTTLLLCGSNLKFLTAKLQQDLNLLSDWLKLNKLKLNVKKMKCMVLHREGLCPEVHLNVDNQSISNVTSFKFLGVTVDGCLSFEQHFHELHLKLLKATFLIGNLSRLIPSYCLRTLYFAYYHSHLTYAMLVWYPLIKKTYQDSLFHMQKRLVRVMCRAPFRSHCMPLFKKLNILMLSDQITVENCKFVLRIINGDCSTPIRRFFGCNLSGTRSGNLIVTKHMLSMTNKSFLCKPSSDWQKLSADLKKCKNRKLLAFKLKHEFIVAY